MGKYEKYAEYKDSGVNYFGEIPSDWKVLNLRYVFDFLNEKRFPLSALERESKKGIYPYYGASGIIDYVDEYLLDEETILIAEDGANLLSRSTPLAFIAKGKYWVNNHAHILKPKNLLFNFWTYFLQSLDYTIYITGSAQPKLSREKLGEVIVLYPSLEEQTQIANFLDHETAKIDSLIEKQQQLIELLKEKRQAVISHAVTKGLNINALMKDSGVEWLGQVPEHWTVSRYKYCTSRVVVGIAEAATHAYSEKGIPIIRATNIKEEGININDTLYLKESFANMNEGKYLYTNDIITVRTGYPGISAVIPETLDKSHCFTNLVSTPKSSHCPHFLNEYLNSRMGKAYFALFGWGSAQKNISVPILQEFPIAYPELAEQKK